MLYDSNALHDRRMSPRATTDTGLIARVPGKRVHGSNRVSVNQEPEQFARGCKALHDVDAANKLTPNVELRKGGPAGEDFHALADVVIDQDVVGTE
mmetsp:Transcript_6563/g.13233  ORF Transcript_6563/g.13233 Transcript_6563/m.13233 type:complete len:96 (+) Transcript_6563:871-1158(+)